MLELLERLLDEHSFKKQNWRSPPAAAQGVRKMNPMIQFRENVPLSEFVSYRIGGPARYFFEFKAIDELKNALREARKRGLRLFVLGGGTNLLVDDAGFDGLVLKPGLKDLKKEDTRFRAGAGLLMENAVAYATREGLSGLEWAGGLPGTVGGAIRGNAGAFGGEMKDVVVSVQSLDIETLELTTRSRAECRFAYRSSIFKERKGKEIVLESVLELLPGNPDAVKKTMWERINYRLERHPMEYPNIGSIFKNVPAGEMGIDTEIPKGKEMLTVEWEKGGGRYVVPVKLDPFPVVPAAYLISEAGLKGKKLGEAMVSPKHPNFIVNLVGATAKDVRGLIAIVKEAVKEKFGVGLEEEVEMV
ncbi:UDP-N-acetylmuramate dehydrogenase [Candidatus Parcubacteria bacterium]|nr:MAG: UDP-N-acetylmuramate dehydrogenase [Candidatus Parcubacteria bacterium]